MSQRCAIWKTDTISSSSRNDGGMMFDSPRAGGRYEITGSAIATLDALDQRQKAFLTSWLVDQHYAGNIEPMVTSEDIRRARTAAPRGLSFRRDGLLKAVAARCPALGDALMYREQILMWSPGDPPRANPFWATADYLLAVTESLEFKEVETLIDFAVQQKLIGSDTSSIALTFDGYTHIEQLSSSTVDSSQAFVAMWFAEELSEAYYSGIAPAISAAGYKPMRIDEKQHNNKIDDEIIAEIRRSRFVVAEFTCGLVTSDEQETAIPRGGVYYEAGFAQGLGIPVIWCCREDHINHVHFDTRQFNHITWRTPAELGEKLRNRIGAVLGDGPLKHDPIL